jgi:hypothetical protein
VGDLSFHIYIPSYKRAKTICTHKLLEYYTVVVRESEYDEYREVIPEENLWAVPDGEIDNIVKVVNYIVDHAPEDVICMIDDDIKNMVYRLESNVPLTDPEIITSEFERIAQLMVDLDIGYAATDATRTPWGYSAEYEFKGTSGGMRWFNKKCYKSRFLEEIGYCCDIDVVLHELLVNRIILKPKYLCTHGGTDTNAGGNSQKVREDQLASVNLMRQKWGKYYSFNEKTNKPRIAVKR